MAKLFAMKLFDTPWLFHVSLAKVQKVNIKFKPNTKSQPDLIGQTRTGNWIVVEAKGRTNAFDQDALVKAKTQTRMIRKINGVDPILRIALQAYFDPVLSVYMDDPPEFDVRAWDLKLEMGIAYTRYYAFSAALRNQRADTLDTRDISGRKFLTHSDSESGVVIGIDTEVIDIISSNNLEKIETQMLKYSANMQVDAAEQDKSIYPDGVLIELDERWSNEQMHREPHQRSAG